MASDSETIASIKSAALLKIAEIQGRPDYNVDNQAKQYQNMVAELKKTVEWCNSQMVAEEPCEFISEIITE